MVYPSGKVYSYRIKITRTEADGERRETEEQEEEHRALRLALPNELSHGDRPS
jgi:hypothetical protein